MRFNHKELAYYASTRFGKADKEGCLWMKEHEGILKKKESESCCENVGFTLWTGSHQISLLSHPSLHAKMVPAHRKPALLLQSGAPGEASSHCSTHCLVTS